jgi:hypothetical protein
MGQEDVNTLYSLLNNNNYYYHCFNCNWVDTRWQQYSTHLHTNITHNTENGTNITKKSLGSAGRARSLRAIPWHLPYKRGKSKGKPQLRWVITSVRVDNLSKGRKTSVIKISHIFPPVSSSSGEAIRKTYKRGRIKIEGGLFRNYPSHCVFL